MILDTCVEAYPLNDPESTGVIFSVYLNNDIEHPISAMGIGFTTKEDQQRAMTLISDVMQQVKSQLATNQPDGETE